MKSELLLCFSTFSSQVIKRISLYEDPEVYALPFRDNEGESSEDEFFLVLSYCILSPAKSLFLCIWLYQMQQLQPNSQQKQ